MLCISNVREDVLRGIKDEEEALHAALINSQSDAPPPSSPDIASGDGGGGESDSEAEDKDLAPRSASGPETVVFVGAGEGTLRRKHEVSAMTHSEIATEGEIFAAA